MQLHFFWTIEKKKQSLRSENILKPILRTFPERIETERLYIRPCQPGDGPDVHQAIESSLAELKLWLPFAEKVESQDEVETGVRESFAKFVKREDFRLHIYRKEDNAFIGSTGLHRIDWSLPKFEIGYWIRTDETKKGYMTEAVTRLVSFAVEHYGAKRVEIRCDPLNENSRKIPERLGFVLEGILRNDGWDTTKENLRDTCVYSILPQEWKFK
jgi:RimJ/RimL family protein N-acetyltransferase